MARLTIVFFALEVIAVMSSNWAMIGGAALVYAALIGLLALARVSG